MHQRLLGWLGGRQAQQYILRLYNLIPHRPASMLTSYNHSASNNLRIYCAKSRPKWCGGLLQRPCSFFLQQCWWWPIGMKRDMLFRISTKIMSILIPVGEKPSCLQATLASGVPHESSQTVPHCMLLQISTLPSIEFDPPRSLMSPFEQRANEMKTKRRDQFIRIQG